MSRAAFGRVERGEMANVSVRSLCSRRRPLAWSFRGGPSSPESRSATRGTSGFSPGCENDYQTAFRGRPRCHCQFSATSGHSTRLPRSVASPSASRQRFGSAIFRRSSDACSSRNATGGSTPSSFSYPIPGPTERCSPITARNCVPAFRSMRGRSSRQSALVRRQPETASCCYEPVPERLVQALAILRSQTAGAAHVPSRTTDGSAAGRSELAFFGR